jgi:hypothetical protein
LRARKSGIRVQVVQVQEEELEEAAVNKREDKMSDENDERKWWAMKMKYGVWRRATKMKMEMEMSEGRRWARGYPIVLVTGSTVVCRKQLLVAVPVETYHRHGQ